MNLFSTLRFWPSAFIFLYILFFIIGVLSGFVRQLFGDMLDWLAIDFHAQDTGDNGYFLLIPHCGHYLVWTRLLTAIDVRVFHGQSLIFVFVSAICLATTFLLLRTAIKTGLAKNPVSSLIATILPLALFLSTNSIDIAIHVNCQYAIMLFFVIAAIIFLCEREILSVYDQFIVILLFLGAVLGSSVGFALIPVILFSLWRMGTPTLQTIFFVLTLLVISLLIVLNNGVLHGSQHSESAPLFFALAKRILYFVSFCGLPWSASSPLHFPLHIVFSSLFQVLGFLIGSFMVAFGLLFLSQQPEQFTTEERRLERIAHAMILFSLVVAMMATVGRANLMHTLYVPVRYALLMAPLHIGLLICLTIRMQTMGKWSFLKKISRKHTFVFCGVILLQQLAGAIVIYKYNQRLNASLQSFAQGNGSPTITDFVYPGNQERMVFVIGVLSEVNKRGLYEAARD